MIPYANIARGDLTPEQRKEQTAWMVQEAQRLVEARQAIPRPAQPIQINQIHDPRQQQVPARQPAIEAATADLIERLRARDRGHYGER